MQSDLRSKSNWKARLPFFAIALPALLLGTQCSAQTPPGAQPAPPQSASVTCREPRPEMCPMIYQPVCGVSRDGSRKTYGNSCSACAVAAVTGYTPGACRKD
jgi:hypothetical protein